MGHFKASTLEAAFEIEALVELGAVEYSLSWLAARTNPRSNSQKHSKRSEEGGEGY